jgi:DNA-binding transcriptional LysR family regulator
MFEWDDARFFLAVTRSGSLSAAARKLKVNQSTVGRRIASLEDALGVRLFERTPEGFALAPGGERFLPRAEKMEDEVDATIREIAGQESRLTGSVRLTTSDAVGPVFVTPLLARFHERFPEIEIELIADNRRLNLSRREADMAVRIGRPTESSLFARRIGNMGYGLYGAAAYVREQGIKDGAIAGRKFVGYDAEHHNTAEIRWIRQHGRVERCTFTSGSTIALVEAVANGFGLGVLPCYIADARSELVRVLPPERVVVSEIWLVLHRDLRQSARMRACADFLADAFARNALKLAGSRRAMKAISSP